MKWLDDLCDTIPKPQSKFNLRTDYSCRDLTMTLKDKPQMANPNNDPIIMLINSCIGVEWVGNRNIPQMQIDKNATANCIVNRIEQELLHILRSKLPIAYPRRAKVYKWTEREIRYLIKQSDDESLYVKLLRYWLNSDRSKPHANNVISILKQQMAKSEEKNGGRRKKKWQ